MKYLPVCVEISRKSILIVGGGKAALQKIKTLENFTGDITVLSPKISDEIRSRSIICIEKEYSAEMLKGFFWYLHELMIKMYKQIS